MPYTYLDSEGFDASLTGANEQLGDAQRVRENQDYWRSELAAIQAGRLGGFTPKSANIPSYEQWMQSPSYEQWNAANLARDVHDQWPESRYISEFYNTPDYSKGGLLEQFASNMPKIMAGGLLGATAGPALWGGITGGATTGAGMEGTLLGDFTAEGADLFGNAFGGTAATGGTATGGTSILEGAAGDAVDYPVFGGTDTIGGGQTMPTPGVPGSPGYPTMPPSDMGKFPSGAPLPTDKSPMGDIFGIPGLTVGDLAKAGINYALQTSLANKYSDAATRAGEMANTLADPRRAPYQAQLLQLLQNPKDFWSTNPAALGQLNLAKQQFEANTGKFGTGGTQFADYLKNVMAIGAGTYNDQANILMTGAGLNQGAGYAGTAYADLQGKALQQRGQAFNIPGMDIAQIINNVFGKMTTPQTPGSQNTTVPRSQYSSF